MLNVEFILLDYSKKSQMITPKRLDNLKFAKL